MKKYDYEKAWVRLRKVLRGSKKMSVLMDDVLKECTFPICDYCARPVESQLYMFRTESSSKQGHKGCMNFLQNKFAYENMAKNSIPNCVVCGKKGERMTYNEEGIHGFCKEHYEDHLNYRKEEGAKS